MRTFCFILLTILACVAVTGCGHSAPSEQAEAVEERPTRVDFDKQAYMTARKAASVKTWDAAIAILERIDIDKIDDHDVIEYVDFSLRCAKVADETGVDRASDPQSPSDVIGKIDWGQIVATLA